jgi:hypothetical protein
MVQDTPKSDLYREYVEAKVAFRDSQSCATVRGIKCKALAKEEMIKEVDSYLNMTCRNQ